MNRLLAEKIINLARLDEEVRSSLLQRGELFGGYHAEMELVHNTNADSFAMILDEYGWPRREDIGDEAARAAWMIVQHAIGKPLFQKRCLELLKTEVNRGQFDPAMVATLEDRIAVFEGKPQRYGTQFDWDHDGNLTPNPILNPSEVDSLRATVGLPPLSEAIEQIRKRAAAEGHQPPKDLKKRSAEFLAWAVRAGWR